MLLDGDGGLWFLASEMAPFGFSTAEAGMAWALGVAQVLGLPVEKVRIELERDPEPQGGGIVMARWDWAK